MSQIVNPSNLEVIAEPTVTPVERIDEVVERAKRAQRLWAGLPQRRRIPALRHLAEFFRAESETLAQVEAANVGKPSATAVAKWPWWPIPSTTTRVPSTRASATRSRWTADATSRSVSRSASSP